MNAWFRFYYKATGRLIRCDYILYANKETKEYLGVNGLVETEIAVDTISETCHQDKDGHGKTVFLMAGRMIYRKGVPLLFDALETLPKNYDYEVRIVGDGSDMAKLQKRYRQSVKLQKHVTFAGRVPFLQMKDEYAKADVFVMPSIRETSGSVMLEAMSNGIPLIAVNRFGSGMLLNDDLGWTFDGKVKQDFIESLATAMAECIKHPEEVKRKGRNMLEAAKKYTWEVKATHFMKIYEMLLNGKK